MNNPPRAFVQSATIAIQNITLQTARYFDDLNSQGIANVESAKFQIRMEAFNRTRFDRAGFRFGNGDFGQVSSLAAGFRPRQLQIVARFEF